MTAALATSATVALAAETDSFRGHTDGSFFSHGEYRPAKVSFLVTGNRVHHVRFEIRVRCPSGQHRSVVGKVRTIPVGNDGRFRFNGAVTGSEGFQASQLFRGRIRGDDASGVARMSITLDSRGNPSSSGSNCVSRKVEWQAHAS